MDHLRNVIDMTSFLHDTRHPSIREVEAYWQGLRAGRLVPRRSDVDPRGIERSLEFAFILERIAPGLARFRIAGSHLSDLMGMEVRGMPLTTFFDPAGRNRAGDVLEQVFGAPATAELTLRGEGGIGKPAMEARMLLLPLKSDLGDMSRALGCLSTQGAIGRTPRRFEIVSHRAVPLIEDAAPAPGSAPTPEPSVVPGFAEPPAGFTPADQPPRARSKPVLRVVKSDDE